MTGTVFDIGYQSYTGVREGRRRSRIAVYKDGLRAALGLGRGPRAKILPWFFISVLSAIALVMALIAGAIERIGGPGSAEKMNLPTHSDYYGIASIITRDEQRAIRCTHRHRAEIGYTHGRAAFDEHRRLLDIVDVGPQPGGEGKMLLA